ELVEMVERIEWLVERADVPGPPLVWQVEAVVAVELVPDEPGWALRVDEQSVEVEQQPADLHGVSLPEWRSSALTSAARPPTRCSWTAGWSERRRSSRVHGKRNPS